MQNVVSHIHRTHRSGWLRAAVLGANDGVLSISSLMLAVVAANTGTREVYVAALAGLVAGVHAQAAPQSCAVWRVF
jgi:VIT1/CCC1 family predicted Fe2+/Mn2+ transporter